jgi:hypothetical protein
MNLEGLIKLVAAWHHHEDVDVAVSVRTTVRVRAEEDDLVRFKSRGRLAREIADDRHWDIGPTIPAIRLRFRIHTLNS